MEGHRAVRYLLLTFGTATSALLTDVIFEILMEHVLVAVLTDDCTLGTVVFQVFCFIPLEHI